MIKKILTIILSVYMVMAVSGCGVKTETLSVDTPNESVDVSSDFESETKVEYYNPLTGLAGISKDKLDDRPVAIMINNISTAQPVQTGIAKADIVYETEVEGGITRLLAVYQDVSKVSKIGSIRSARYPYVDLALGHNAIYLHHGSDPTYCGPHLKDIDDINIDENNYATRIKNGLSSEHTLYTYGEKLWSGMVKDGIKTENSNSNTWVSFADAETPVSYTNVANAVSVSFSSSYKTTFKYDMAASSYVRYFNNTIRKDYNTGETFNFKNVFVLMTTIKDYPDGYHRQVLLESGTGYYCVNGTYTEIKWSKGNAKNGFKFINVDGTELKVNPGNSWVCIVDKTKSVPVFE